MYREQLKSIIVSLKEMINKTSMETSCDDLLDLLDAINFINYEIGVNNIIEMSLNGRKGFWFIKPNEQYQQSLDARNKFIRLLDELGSCPYGINRSTRRQISKLDIYVGDIAGIWTDTLYKFQYEAPEDVKKTIAHQCYSILKSVDKKLDYSWIK